MTTTTNDTASLDLEGPTARCIRPFQTIGDGDTLWCATTGEVAPVQSFTALAELASETAWDAVLRAVEPETDQQGGA